MADTEKKKNKTVSALRESVDIIAPVIDKDTILRIVIPVTPREEGDTESLSYSAIFVNDRWYLTGSGRGPIATEYRTTHALLVALSAFPKATIELATTFESIR